MAGGRARDGVDGFGDAMQRRVRADGHVGAVHIVVDRADQPDDGEVAMLIRRVLGDCAGLDQFVQQRRPFLPEEVRAGQTAVAADDHERIDLMLDEILRGRAPPVAGAEVIRSGRADDGAALAQNAADRIPVHLADPIAAIDHALIAFVDRVHRHTAIERGADDGAHGRVHAGRIAAAGQYCQTFGCHSH